MLKALTAPPMKIRSSSARVSSFDRQRQLAGVALDPALVPMARESVTAHLIKLQREGRARRDGDAWTMI